MEPSPPPPPLPGSASKSSPDGIITATSNNSTSTTTTGNDNNNNTTTQQPGVLALAAGNATATTTILTGNTINTTAAASSNNGTDTNVKTRLKQLMQELGIRPETIVQIMILQENEKEEENKVLESKKNNKSNNNTTTKVSVSNQTSIILNQWISKHLLIQKQFEIIQKDGLKVWRVQRGQEFNLSQEENDFIQEHGSQAWKYLLVVAEENWKVQQQCQLVQQHHQYIQKYGMEGWKHAVGVAEAMHKEKQQYQLLQQQYQYMQEYGFEAFKDTVELAEEMQKEEQHRALQELLANKDIWIGKIMAYVGPGQFRFVPGVCKDFYELYSEYFFNIIAAGNKIPSVWDSYLHRHIELTCQHTYQSSAFSSLDCATIWDNETKGKPGRLPDNDVCGHIAEFGSLDVLKWAHEVKQYPLIEHQRALRNAMIFGIAPTKDIPTILSLAAKGGNLDMLIWLRDKKGFVWDEDTVHSAALGGYFNVASYLLDNHIPVDPQLLAKQAAGKGRVDTLKWSLDLGATWTDEVAYIAAYEGSINVLKWALEHGHNQWVHGTLNFEGDEAPVAAVAAKSFKCETLKWLIEDLNCEVDDVRICNSFAGSRASFLSIEMLEWLRKKGCPWDEGACSRALECAGNHAGADPNPGLVTLCYLRKNGCPWDEETKRVAQEEFDYQDNYGACEQYLDMILDETYDRSLSV